MTHSLSVGMPIPQRTVGALNLYSAADHPFSAESVALAEGFAGYAGVAVANAALYQSAVQEARHMHAALKTRAVIDQAKGILMGARGCSADDAFRLLTAASQHQNRKLRDIALEMVDQAQPPPRATEGSRAGHGPSGPRGQPRPERGARLRGDPPARRPAPSGEGRPAGMQ